MIVVDSSVWIDYFNNRNTTKVAVLEGLAGSPLLVGDLIMVEVLQGFRRESDFRAAIKIFSELEVRSMVGRDIAIAAAYNYRALRERGITPRKTIDTLVATFCILNGHRLLHNERDFDHFEEHLGLRVLTS